ncbi:MAG: FAD-binding protein [Paludibacteraceae bacterium]|nr:FAD-binding protein [Paludibacteraceae bacterium]
MNIYTDNIHKMAYATDASAYREIPLAVAYPENEDDLRQLLYLARERHTYLIPRAGGTSIAGQVVGKGIVVDVSRYMNKIISIDPERRVARVQPGVVRDELNMALRPYGLFFSPETSTSNRCCLGGMVGNNSCGTHSLIYGSTRQHVVGLRLMLTDGSIVEVGREKTKSESDLWQRIVTQLVGWQTDTSIRQRIEENFPDKSLKRRSCGYALDECLWENDGLMNDGLNIPALITGSEGTLALVTEIELSLDPLPSEHKVLVAAHLNNLNDSWAANLIALRHCPTAVELMDGRILDLCKDNKQAQEDRFFVQGEPNALVIAEFTGDEVEKQATAFENDVQSLAYACTRVYDKDISRVWNLRKAGLGVLNGMQGDAKPVGVIEDTAVAPERLEAYMLDFQAMMKQFGLDCVYYGHISTGELHLRPILNLKKEEDRVLFRQVAEATARLVKKHHGSLSGEHGDGRLRGEFIPLMYGQEVYQLMCELKHTWDPDGVLNMGKIVNTPPMDSALRAQSTILHPQSTHLLQRVERCNGAADCRKSQLIGGSLCPAYKVSGDELMTTRARANVIREVLTTQRHPWTNKDIQHQLDSCLACKSCIRECSSSVDMTRIRAELLQERYNRLGIPFRTWLIAHMPEIEALGAKMPKLYNWCATNKWISAIIKAIVGFDQRREIPRIEEIGNEKQKTRNKKENIKKKRNVYLFLDEFTRHQEPQLAQDFIALLNALGYEVIIPKHVQSGRAAISKGCLKYARKQAVRNVNLLADIITDDAPLVGIEPSCILSFRDEYPDLVSPSLRDKAKALGNNALLYDEFLLQELQAGRINKTSFRPLQADIWLHGHCHQKALVGIEKTAALLRLIPESTLHIIPSGCCGMAGSFGYEKRHYATSMAIGELVLFPTIRKTLQNTKTIVAAPGTSCRQQIYDGTGVRAVHPIQVLKQSVIQ